MRRGTPAGWADKTVMGLFGTGSYEVMSIWPPRLLRLCCCGQINVKTNPHRAKLGSARTGPRLEASTEHFAEQAWMKQAMPRPTVSARKWRLRRLV